jgi:hypothetical protein
MAHSVGRVTSLNHKADRQRGPIGPDPMLVTLLGFLAAAFLVAGLVSGYLFEMDGYVDSMEALCPAPSGSEGAFDERCVTEIISRGPLYLGKGYLAASFLSGGIAIGGVFLVGRRALTHLVAALFLTVYHPIGGALVFWSMAPGLVQGAFFLGVIVIGGAILLARDSPRRATVFLSATYVVAWAGLLSWNVAEGQRIPGMGL